MTRIVPKNITGARKSAMPDFLPPQLATLAKQPPSGNEWLHELKFDGYRMLCHLNKGKAKFWSRNAKDWTERFSSLEKPLKKLPAVTAILDGEVVVVDPKGRSSFQRLQQGIATGAALVFQVFDVIYLDGYLLTRTPLRERKAVLEQLMSAMPAEGPVRYSDHIEGNGQQFFKQACEYGIEGIVSKLADSVYESTRTKSWLKVKCNKRQEFVVVGYTPSDKGFPGFGSLVLGVYGTGKEKGKLFYAGRVGTGFSIKKRLELQKMLDQIAQPAMPFASKPKDTGLRKAFWAKPKLIAEVEFTEWTDEGIIRHPSFKGLREDKKPSDVIREEPTA